MPASYVGRFAPSPSGPLHMGSLVCALASFLDAKHQEGKWLIRIEDVDNQRCKAIHSQDIIQCLASYHLVSDEEILFQSQQSNRYQTHLDWLIEQGNAFPCQCTRQIIKQNQGKHLDICQTDKDQAHAWRLITPNRPFSFQDKLQGHCQQTPYEEVGHSIIRRKDLDYAYLLAVVLDDYTQGVNQIIRGMDLLDTTASQIHLYQTLGWPIPEFCHIPLVLNEQNLKLSKQNHATAIPHGDLNTLRQALMLLKQPINLALTNLEDTLNFAIQNWSLANLKAS